MTHQMGPGPPFGLKPKKPSLPPSLTLTLAFKRITHYLVPDLVQRLGLLVQLLKVLLHIDDVAVDLSLNNDDDDDDDMEWCHNQGHTCIPQRATLPH